MLDILREMESGRGGQVDNKRSLKIQISKLRNLVAAMN